jgi:acylphosphatase
MKKCLKIVFSMPNSEQFLLSVQKSARNLGVEGTLAVLPSDRLVRIIAHGEKEKVDSFFDVLHKEGAQVGVHDITAEPMLKEKDYRGVFRIIE